MEMGAVAYFPKTMSGKAMVQAFQMVMDEERFMPLDQKGASMMPAYHPATYARPEKFNDDKASYYGAIYTGVHEDQKKIENGGDQKALTPREKDVLGFLAKGASNKEIARELALQIVTVKLHVRGICRKLGVQNRTQAALKAQHIAL
jgi:DNA-binding NarL/FixJ family response regulator